MKWRKLGQLFEPKNEFPWMVTHAANPFGWPLNDGKYKIFFTCRDKDNRSHIGYLIMDMDNGFNVIDVGKTPILRPGSLGLFDDSGVAMGFLFSFRNDLYLYYLGWNLKVTVPWMNSIGLAISKDNGRTFEKVSRAPILDRSHEDPFSISYPSIMNEEGMLKMWYGSNLNWGSDQSNMNHVIKYATSEDGTSWHRDGKIVLDLEHKGEYALSKPFVIRRNGYYEMWYSYRASEIGDTYRIGFASSQNGLIWNRRDSEAGINVSAKGWDSEMIEYPFVFDHGGERFMLYNGNGYGKTGFGIARLESINETE